MTRKKLLLFAIGICLLIILPVGRIRTKCGVIEYQAKTPEAVLLFRSKIEALRMALRADSRFIEVTNGRTLEFNGARNTEFEGCWIAYDRDERDAAKDSYAMLAVDTTSTFSFNRQVHDLRAIVGKAFGPSVLKQFTINFEPRWIDMR
jgi:hypothetical protein